MERLRRSNGAASAGWFPCAATALAALACCLVALAPGRQASAALRGSLHDFQRGPHPNALPQSGSCSPCHVPHGGQARGLWPRALGGTGQEAEFFDQDAEPNYVPAATLLCYDCHDDGATTETVPDPDPAVWTVSHRPQDVALGGAAKVGYYELLDGARPGPGRRPPTDGSATGGHYWKSEPTMAPDYKRGDKIRCDLCHDPHDARTGTNEAMFLTSTRDGRGGSVSLGDGLTASDKDDLANPNRSRTGTGTGREMCAACHAYADSGTPVTIADVELPRPPATVPQHALADKAPCTKCHAHDKVAVSCRECHGYPPLLTAAEAGGTFDRLLRPDAESYPNGAGAHRRHREALGEAIFACPLCHGPDPGSAPWHNEGGGAVLQGNVDVMGQGAWWGTASGVGYAGAAGGTPPSGYAFAAKGANDGAAGGRCHNLACHGDPPDQAGALNWTDDMARGDTPESPGALDARVCSWCHDATPARIGSGPRAPNVMGDGATWGAQVNGHGLAAGAYEGESVGESPRTGAPAADKPCTVCHDATWAGGVPARAHFDGVDASAEKRLRATINGVAVADADAACPACHDNAGGPDSATGRSQVPGHDNAPAGGYTPIEPAAFERRCRQCHDVHGANWNGAGRNLHMVGRWLDANRNGLPDPGEEARVDTTAGDEQAALGPADLRVVLTAATGAGSYDAGNDEGLSPPRGVCVVCHVALVNGHSQVGDSVPRGTGHNPVGGDCTSCHRHENGFRAAGGCTGCHGDAAAGTHLYPDEATAAVAESPDRAGRHASHVARIAAVMGEGYSVSDASTCSWCHPNGRHSGDAVAPAELQAPGGYRSIAGEADADGRTAVQDGSTNVSCSGIDCHYNRTMPAADWYDWTPALPITCSYCHSYQTNYDAATRPLPNAHTVHVDEFANGGRNLDCDQCHPDFGLPDGPGLPHEDGRVDVVFDDAVTIGEPGAEPGVASGSDRKVKYGRTGGGFLYATCSRLFCHGDDTFEDGEGFGLAGGTLTAPRWDVPADGDCGTCHDTGTQPAETSPGTALATGGHPAHLTAPYGPRFGTATTAAACDPCHPPRPAAGYPASHADGTASFRDLDGAVADLAATDGCDNCHGASVPAAKGEGNWADGAYRLPCVECHDAADPANSARDGSGVDAPPKSEFWVTRGHGATVFYPWEPRRSGAGLVCGDCHAPASAHIGGGTGDTDRLSTAGNALCAGCHAGGAGARAETRVSTHGNRSTTMDDPPTLYTARRAAFELNCVECHDPHGTENDVMVNPANPDGPLVAPRTYADATDLSSFLFRGSAVRFVGTAGSAFAHATPSADRICQTCHTTTGGDVPVYRHDQPTAGHPTGPCTVCHAHDVDEDYGTNSQDGFMTRGGGCEGCHDGTFGSAPNVMEWWTGRLGNRQDGGHGDPDGRDKPARDGGKGPPRCEDCHDTTLPPGTHGDGELQSFTNGIVNGNTSHLKAEFFDVTRSSPPPPVAPGTWGIQVAFDNYCAYKCHTDQVNWVTQRVRDMRHMQDTEPKQGDPPGQPPAPNRWSVELGTHLTKADGEQLPANYPIDADLTTDADVRDVDYVPCVACHDPHGTDTPPEVDRPSNRMLRDTFFQPPDLCAACHI